MAEVLFPSPWKVWTQSQREAMFRDYVTGTCKQRGYSDEGKWHSPYLNEKGTLSDHISTFLANNRGRLDTYSSTKTVAKLAAYHLCPDELSSNPPSGAGTQRSGGLFMSAVDLVLPILLPWRVPGEQIRWGGRPSGILTFGGVIDKEGGAQAVMSPALDASISGDDAADMAGTSPPIEQGAAICRLPFESLFLQSLAPAIP